MFTVAALSEYLDLKGSDSPAFLALYSRVVTTLSPSDRALLEAVRAEKVEVADTEHPESE